MSMDVHSVMRVENLRNLRIKSAWQCVVFAYSTEYSAFHYHQNNPYCSSVVINVPMERFLVVWACYFILHLNHIYRFLSTFHKNVLHTYHVPNPMLGFVDLKMNETHAYIQKAHGLMEKKYA